MTVGFHTLGCKLNQFETEALAAAFSAAGHMVVGAEAEADLYVINTCTVTTRADHKARAVIRSVCAGHPEAPVIVTGCSAELEGEVLSRLAPNIIVVPQSDKAALLDLPRRLAGQADARRALADRAAVPSDPFSFSAPEMSFHTRAYLKIQDGCDHRCASCRVPLARGPSASMDAERAAAAASDLERRGYREIVITGVNISAYRSGETDLAALMERMCGAAARARLRLSSLEPEAITGRLLQAAAHPRICPHFHLPVQSGSDRVLLRMRRRYTADRVRSAVDQLRRIKDDPFLAADVIVGFPGEADRDFQDTKNLIESMGFSALHVFPFSPRPGTAAALMDGQVPERERSRRAAELTALSRVLKAGYQSRWVGRETEVLFERASDGAGTALNYMKVRVEGLPQGGTHAGRIGRVRIQSLDPADPLWGVRGAFLGFSD